MKHIFVMRHGQAEPYSSRDELRELTSVGIREVTDIAATLTQHTIPKMFCSPYLRTVQTAEIISSIVDIDVTIDEHLTPNMNPESVIDFIYRTSDEQKFNSILLVSHMPLVSRLIESLDKAENESYSMSTAALAYLSGEVLAKDCCELHWIKTP